MLVGESGLSTASVGTNELQQSGSTVAKQWIDRSFKTNELLLQLQNPD